MLSQYNNPISESSNLYDFFVEDDSNLYQNELDIVESDNDHIVYEESENENGNENEVEDDEDEIILGCGLTNMGNTCYMNAVIQALANIELFASLVNCKTFTNMQLVLENFFKKFKPSTLKEIEEYKDNKCFTIAFDKTIEILSSNQYNAITPTSIRKAVVNTLSEFNNNQQHDASDFLLSILNKLDEELTYTNIQINIESEKYKKIYDEYKCLQPNEKKIYFKNLSEEDKDKFSGILSYINFNKTYSPIQEMFQFIIKSTITCSICNNKSVSFSPEWIMALEIPDIPKSKIEEDSTSYFYNGYNSYNNSYNNFNRYSHFNYNSPTIYNGLLTTSDDDQETEPDKSDSEEVNDETIDTDSDSEYELSIHKCLEKFFSVETLTCDNHYFCNVCKKKVEATKKLILNRLAPVLVFQFKRFKQHGNTIQKNTDEIDFPFSLNLKKYTEHNDDKIYELRSVIHHEGLTPQHGHYTTYVNSIDDKWLYCNDENINIETNLELIKDDDAYILLYEEVKN